MNDQQPGGRAHAIFAGAVPDEVAAAYEKLAEAGGVPEEEAAEFVGGEHIKQQLIDSGMAITPNEEGKLVATPLSMALLGVANGAHRQLGEMTQMVRDLVLAAYQADDGHPPNAPLAGMLDYYTDRDEIIGVSATLINSTRREWLAVDNLHRESPLAEGSRLDGLKTIRDSIVRRCIYDRDFMRDPVGRQIVRSSIAAGEEARLYPGIEMKMQIADGSAALLPCSLSGMSGAVLIRVKPIIRGLRQLFELLWEKAQPVGGNAQPDGKPLTGRQNEVLHLLAQGLRHGEIARQTGLSLSMVHKHAENISKLLHADSPFQAGIEAHRRGWTP